MIQKFFAFLLACPLLYLTSYAQKPLANQPNQGTTANPNLKTDPSKIKIADTTNLKLNKLVNEFAILEEENKNLTEELNTLKSSLNSLTSKLTEIQKDNAALKLMMQGTDKSLSDLYKLKPIAYGVFVPIRNAVTRRLEYVLTNSYGISKKPEMVDNKMTITLDQDTSGEPIVFTSKGMDGSFADARATLTRIHRRRL